MKSILFIFVLLATALCQAQQLKVYATYQDYVNKVSTNYDMLESYDSPAGKAENITIKALLKGKQKKIKCSKIYGYEIRDSLYRIYPKLNIPVRLEVKGKLYYYSSLNYSTSLTVTNTKNAGASVGINSIEGSTTQQKTSSRTETFTCAGKEFFSVSLSDTICEIPKSINIQSPEKFDARIQTLKTNLPAYTAVFDCFSAAMKAFAAKFNDPKDKRQWGVVKPPQVLFYLSCF